MPVGYNSPARNLFLLGATGQQEITAFIRRITTPSVSDTYGYEPARIEYEETDQKYLVVGSQVDGSDTLYEGFLTKANEVGTKTFDIKIQSTETSTSYGTTIRSMAQDSNGNIIVCGRTGQTVVDNAGSPYVGKFDFDGLTLWFQSTSEIFQNALIEYTDISIDSNDDIYVIGAATPNAGLPNNSILSKYLSDGTIVWSKRLLDDGSDGFGDFKFRNVSINSRDELIVTGSLEGITKRKGVVAKYDTFGNQIWIKTFEDPNLGASSNYLDVTINSSYVDGNDYIYCVGDSYDSVSGVYSGIAFRLTPEGNIVWQKKTNYSNSIRYTSVSADTLTGQMILAGDVWAGSGTGGFTIAQRFTASGFLTWTRKLSSVNARSAYVNISSDPSYYYLIFADELTSGSDPESFLYGKLSITGNGLGAFAYNDGVTDQNYVVIPLGVKNGTLTDGSLRNDVSDFITYPHNPVKVLFDDLTMIYQPKQPVHDGSDHEIVSQNVLSEPALTVLATDTSYIDTSSFQYVSVQPNGTGTGTIGGFAVGDHIRFGLTTSGQPANSAWSGGSSSPTATSARFFDTFALDLRRRQTITFSLIRGNGSNGGEYTDSGEDFRIWYSIDNKQTWTEAIQIVVEASNTNFDTLNTVTSTIPSYAKTQETYLRIGQRQSSGYEFDHWGLTQFVLDETVISSPREPKISADGIVYGSNLLLNYDFKNRATYDRAENLVRNSENFTASTWVAGGSQGLPTRTLSDVMSPFGTKNVYLLNDTSVGVDGQATDQNVTITPSITQQYTVSVYAKQGTAGKFDMYVFFTGVSVKGTRLSFVWGTKQIFTNASDGGGADAIDSGYEDIGNGWYRIWMVVSDSNFGTNPILQLRLYPGSRDTGLSGSTYFWGAQVEKGSTLGRYIKTYGTAITPPTTVKNLSSTSYTGTINGATFNPAGYFEFNNDGTTLTDWIEVPSFTGFPGGNNSFSHSFWMRTDFLTSIDDPEAVIFYGAEAQGEAIRIRVVSSGALVVGHWGGAGYDWTTNPGVVSSNTWHHICETYDGTTNENILYVDGVQAQIPVTINNLSIPSSATLYLGRRITSDAANYNGDVGGLLVYNRTLSATEVSQNFNATRSKYGV